MVNGNKNGTSIASEPLYWKIIEKKQATENKTNKELNCLISFTTFWDLFNKIISPDIAKPNKGKIIKFCVLNKSNIFKTENLKNENVCKNWVFKASIQ